MSQTLLDVQIKELVSLKDFLEQKDSVDQLFDIYNIVDFNIRAVRKQIAPNSVSPKETKEIEDFFRGGQVESDLRYFKNVNGVAILEAPQNTVWGISTSGNFMKNKQILMKYKNSALLPSNVREAVEDLNNTLDLNWKTLGVILTQKIREAPADIIDADKIGSTRQGVTRGQYLMRAQQLQPKVDAITTAIRAYLDIR